MINKLQRGFFALRFRLLLRLFGSVRKIWFSFLGMKIGSQSFLPRIYVTWPHQVSIGNDCSLEHDIYFKFDGIWQP